MYAVLYSIGSKSGAKLSFTSERPLIKKRTSHDSIPVSFLITCFPSCVHTCVLIENLQDLLLYISPVVYFTDILQVVASSNYYLMDCISATLDS